MNLSELRQLSYRQLLPEFGEVVADIPEKKQELLRAFELAKQDNSYLNFVDKLNKNLSYSTRAGWHGIEARRVIAKIPRGLRFDCIKRADYLAEQNKSDYQSNVFLYEISEQLRAAGKVYQDREEINEAAALFARLCLRHNVATGAQFCEKKGIKPPKLNQQNITPYLMRIKCDKWWARKLSIKNKRNIEAVAIKNNFVNQFSAQYISRAGFDYYQESKKHCAKVIKQLEAINEETGEAVELERLIKASLANPANRFAEMVTRAKGFDEYAQKHGDRAYFFTMTAPSKYHASLSKTGKKNPKYNGATPKDTQAYFCKIWAQIRSAAARRGLYVYGFRVAEPHHDGTPHWHLLLYIKPESAREFSELFRTYASSEDNAELFNFTRKKARFDVKDLGAGGGAVGYLIKYIAKNINHLDNSGMDFDSETGAHIEESAERVRAWASVWGIRQFQQIGGARVGIWRELRRLEADEDRPKKLEQVRAAADAGSWCDYLELMQHCKIKLDKSLIITNRYAEEVKKVIGIIYKKISFITRPFKWVLQLKNKSERSEQTSRASGAWSCVNNCTQPPPIVWQPIEYYQELAERMPPQQEFLSDYEEFTQYAANFAFK